MPDLVQTIKQAALEAVEAANPVQLAYGTVVSASPLKVQVGDKQTLPAKALIIPKSLTTRKVELTVSWATDAGSGLDTQHSHTAQGTATSTDGFDPSHTHRMAGRLTATLHAGFSVGDKVLLLRMQGGQKYMILDKVVDA